MARKDLWQRLSGAWQDGNRCSRPCVPGGIDTACRSYLPGKDGGMDIGASDGTRPSPAR